MAQWESDARVLLLKELTEIPSGSGNIAGVDSVQEVVASELRKIGFQPRFETHPEGTHRSGKLLVAELGEAPAKGPFISLVTHADTVFESESASFSLDPSAGTARGPGVLDDKAGIVVAIEGVKRFLARASGGLAIRFICAPTEELGSPGLQEIFARLGRESRMVLGFEPGLENGSIIRSRRGNRWYHIQVEGREGHAGRDFSRGVNAAHELAHKLVQMQRLTDLSKDLTVSTGQISGGTKFNVICGHAEAKVDVRFSDYKTRDEAHRVVESIIEKAHIAAASDGARPSASYQIENDCPPFSAGKDSEPFVARYLELIREIEGAEVQAIQSGGAADSNYMAREGLVVIDGLGGVGGKIHSGEEFLRLSSLETRAESLARFLSYVEKGSK